MKRAALPKSRATGGSSSRSNPTATTPAPAATKALTAERPIPPVPPITTIRLPSKTAEALRGVAIVKCLGKQAEPSITFPSCQNEELLGNPTPQSREGGG